MTKLSSTQTAQIADRQEQQLRLQLPHRAALGREDFFVCDSNALAVSVLDDWRNWPNGKMVLTGPKGAGKSHLAHVWAHDQGARILAPWDIATALPQDLANGPIVLDGLEALASSDQLETALFHLHNLMAAEGHPFLMTSRQAPARLSIKLPDLRSRLEAAAVVRICEPDDTLISALLVKLFSDRGMSLKPQTLAYVVARIEHSFAAAQRFVALMDARSLAEDRRANKGLARDVLEELSREQPPL